MSGTKYCHAFATVVAALALAACSSGTVLTSGAPASKTSIAGVARSTSVPADCNFLSRAQIDQVLGSQYPALVSQMSSQASQSCQSNPADGTTDLLTINIEIGGRCAYAPTQSASLCTSDAQRLFEDAKTSNTAREVGAPVSITGVGSQAICQTDTQPGLPSSGTVDATIGYLNLTVAADTCAEAEAIARLVASKLA